MSGKVLKISNNDLYGNVDDRVIIVFAAFNHVKYMNKYIIFTYKDEYDKKKLYYGSVHLKENSLVTFAIKEELLIYIDDFVDKFLTLRIDSNEYEILDISSVSKIELVSYNERDFDKLLELEQVAIVKEEKVEEEIIVNKKPVFLYILLIFFSLLGIGLTFLYVNPDAFLIELKELKCNLNGYDQEIQLGYVRTKNVRFDTKDRIRDISVDDVYKFIDIDKYYDFKNNNKESEYFKIDGGYKYDDNSLELKIMYKEETVIEDYTEMFNYLKGEGYTCVEGKYYE